MQELLSIPLAVGLGVLGMTAFAVIRRVMRSAHPPRWLEHDVVAFASALILTAYFAMTLIVTAWVLMPLLGSIVYATIAAMVLHLLYWVAVRLIIPVTDADEGAALPPAAPAV